MLNQDHLPDSDSTTNESGSSTPKDAGRGHQDTSKIQVPLPRRSDIHGKKKQQKKPLDAPPQPKAPQQQTRQQTRQPKRRTLVAMRTARTVLQWCASGPVSLALSVTLTALFVVGLIVGREVLEPNIVFGIGAPWWTLFTAFSWITSWLHLLTDVLLLLTVGIFLERLVGSAWYAVSGFASYWLGSVAAAGTALGITTLDQDWGEALREQSISGALVFLIGTALAASVKMPGLWARRVWITTGAVLLVMVSFGGTLNTLAMVFAALVGLGIGFIFWGTERDKRPVQGSRNEGRTLVALIVGGMVVGILVALRAPELSGALVTMRWDFVGSDLPPESVVALCNMDGLEGQCAHYRYLMQTGGIGSKILAVAPLIMQLVLAWGLLRGRRAAMWGTIILQGMSALVAAVHLTYVGLMIRDWDDASQLLGFNELGQPTARFIVPIVVPIVLIVLLVATRRFFTVGAARGTYSRFWTLLGAITSATLALSVILAAIFRSGTEWVKDIGILIVDFIVRLLPSTVLSLVAPQAVLDNRTLMLILEWAPLVPWVAAIILVWISFGRLALPQMISRERYVEILRATDGGTMSWMGTWDGNYYWGSQKYEAAVAFRADRGVALTVSDPLARTEDLEEVLVEFTQFCVDQDLTPAFYSVHAPVAQITDQWGWPRLEVAEETILNLPDLAFKGKSFQDIRTALNHASKQGITSKWTTWDECPENLRDQIKDISDTWVGDKSLPEMGFTLGGLAELADPDVPILLALDEEEVVHGVTSWMPVYREGTIIGWTLDFMRRKEDGFRPVMEYLIAEAALWAQEEKFEILSLSGAPLAKAKNTGSEESLEGSSAAYLDAVLKILGSALEPVYGFSSLLRFKAKFKPEYQAVFLTVPDVTSLPNVGLSIAHAYIPEMTARDMLHLAQSMRGTDK